MAGRDSAGPAPLVTATPAPPVTPIPAAVAATPAPPVAATAAPPVPSGWRLRIAAGVRVVRGGEVLIGGSPLRSLTLTARAASLVQAWLAGQPVGRDGVEGDGHGGGARGGGARDGGDLAERLLARRLLDAGLVDPDPPARPHGRLPPCRDESPAEVTIVVPVYADPARLRACLTPLVGHDPPPAGSHPPPAGNHPPPAGNHPIIVVDDGSPDGRAIAAVAKDLGARYLRLPENRGAAAARNTGLRAASTPFVAFLDADCVPPPGFPDRLLDHLADPAIALIAPRIVSAAPHRAGRIAAYERVRSALDMGGRPALVRPYAHVWYVPSAAMVARRDALGAGFDEVLRLGEDVDLVWRLHDSGRQVRYEPRVTVAHEDRVRPVAWYRRRVAYNESVAPLLRRHPERVPVLFLSPLAAFAWGAALGGFPAPVALLTAIRAVRLGRALSGRLPGATAWAARTALDITIREAHDLGRALAGPWAPFAPLAGRRRLALLLATMIVRDWLEDRPSLDPLSYVALRLADESSRGVGIWLGCLRARDFRALLPRRPPPPSRR